MSIEIMERVDRKNQQSIAEYIERHERKRSNALPKVHVFQHTRNAHKHMEVVHYACGNYYAVQFMQWGSIRNNLGSASGRRFRCTKSDLSKTLQDYIQLY